MCVRLSLFRAFTFELVNVFGSGCFSTSSLAQSSARAHLNVNSYRTHNQSNIVLLLILPVCMVCYVSDWHSRKKPILLRAVLCDVKIFYHIRIHFRREWSENIVLNWNKMYPIQYTWMCEPESKSASECKSYICICSAVWHKHP